MNFRKKGVADYVAAALACWAQGPIEALFGGWLKGPLRIKANSSAVQWAGRTSIPSGSATITVSTRTVNSDSLIALDVLAALPAAYATEGVVAIAAAAATGTFSSTAVFSDRNILLTVAAATNQASGVGRSFRVNSIVDGVSAAIVTDDGQNVTSGPQNVGWSIPSAVPQGLKVNTIGVGFFTIGWADQKARPVDTTALWEVRRTS